MCTPPDTASSESPPLTAAHRAFTDNREVIKPGRNVAERTLDHGDTHTFLLSGRITRVYWPMTLAKARKKLKEKKAVTAMNGKNNK